MYDRLSLTNEKVFELNEIIKFIGAVIAKQKAKNNILVRKNEKIEIEKKYAKWE